MNQVAKTTDQKNRPTIKQHLSSDGLRNELAKILPKHVTAERMARIAITAITRNPKLQNCDQASFFKCLMDLSQWGLEPDGRRAHLIPFNNRRAGIVECQLIIDYKGLVELAMRTGKISKIHAEVVCENDEFVYDRGEVVRHAIDFRKPRGEVYAVYAMVKMKDGSEKFEVMSREDVESIRNRSRASSGPWDTDWNEMAKKTVFRRLSKWIPLSAEIQDAIQADDRQFGFVDGIVNQASRISVAAEATQCLENLTATPDALPEDQTKVDETEDAPDNEDSKPGEEPEITESVVRHMLAEVGTKEEAEQLGNSLIEKGADEKMIAGVVGEFIQSLEEDSDVN